MGKGGPPHRFILPRPGFLSFTTSEPVTKDPASGCIMEEEWWHGEKRQELYGSHSPDAFAGKVSTHQSFSQLQNQRPLMNAWEYLESFALLKKLIPGQFLDYNFMYSTRQHILSQRFLQFTLNCPSFLSKVRFYGSVAGKATVFHVWNPCCLWKLIQE